MAPVLFLRLPLPSLGDVTVSQLLCVRGQGQEKVLTCCPGSGYDRTQDRAG